MWYEDTTAVKIAITVILALVCSISMVATHGQSGIGWFIFGLMLIW